MMANPKSFENELHNKKLKQNEFNFKKELSKKEADSIPDLKYILESMPGYVFWKNIHLEYIGCNNNLAKIFGIEYPSEIIGKTDYDVSWKEFAEVFQKEDQIVIKTKKIVTTETLLPFKQVDGSDFWIRTDKMPLYDKKGNVIGVIAIGVDISDQKSAQEKFNIEHTFIEDILYNLPGLIYWKNKKSQYVGFNKNVVLLSGLKRKELIGKTDMELNWGRKEAESFKKDDKEVMETGIIKITEHTIPIKRPDGNFMVVRTEKSRLYDRQGNIVGVLGVALDITEQKLLEKQITKAKEKAERLSRSKTEFLRNMEHDIRTPFGGIYSIARSLANQETDKEKKEYLKIISSCAKELLDYFNGILDFSRLESGTLPAALIKFNMRKIIDSVVKMEIPPAEDKNIPLIVDYPDAIPKILIGDPYRVQRILINLISNAIKFTNKGQIKISIRIAKKFDKENILLQLIVADTGVGISKENQAFIYEKFNRLTPANRGNYKGSGLGLGIVKQLVQEIDGEINVESEVNKGTIFTCTIPFKTLLADELSS